MVGKVRKERFAKWENTQRGNFLPWITTINKHLLLIAKLENIKESAVSILHQIPKSKIESNKTKLYSRFDKTNSSIRLLFQLLIVSGENGAMVETLKQQHVLLNLVRIKTKNKQ